MPLLVVLDVFSDIVGLGSGFVATVVLAAFIGLVCVL